MVKIVAMTTGISNSMINFIQNIKMNDSEKIWSITFSLLMAAIQLTICLNVFMNCDVGMYLYAAELLMNGGPISGKFIDSNPPFVVYFYFPAVYLAFVVGADIVTTFHLYLIGIFLTVFLLDLFLIDRMFEKETDLFRFGLFAALVTVSLYLPGTEFGQREHILFVLSTPYLLNMYLRLIDVSINNKWLIIVGAIAGVGVVLKIYNIFAYMLVELLAMSYLKKKWFTHRADLIAFLLTVFGLTAIIMIRESDYFEWATMLMKLGSEAGHSKQSLADNLINSGLVVIAQIAVTVFLSPTQFEKLLKIFWIYSVSFLISAAYYGKGYPYHFYPIWACGYLSFFIAVPPSIRIIKGKILMKKFITYCAVAVIIIAAMDASITILRHQSPSRDQLDYRYRLLGQLKSIPVGSNVFFLDYSVSPGFPLLNYAKMKSVSRFPFVWPLYCFYHDDMYRNLIKKGKVFHSPDEMGSYEKKFFNMIIQDILRQPPDLIVIDQYYVNIVLSSLKFPLLDYLLQDHDFKKLWADYILIEKAPEYMVYLRKRK